MAGQLEQLQLEHGERELVSQQRLRFTYAYRNRLAELRIRPVGGPRSDSSGSKSVNWAGYPARHQGRLERGAGRRIRTTVCPHGGSDEDVHCGTVDSVELRQRTPDLEFEVCVPASVH